MVVESVERSVGSAVQSTRSLVATVIEPKPDRIGGMPLPGEAARKGPGGWWEVCYQPAAAMELIARSTSVTWPFARAT